MTSTLILLSLINIMLVILYVHARIRLHKSSRNFQQEQTRIQQEVSFLQNKINFHASDPVTHLMSWQLFEDRLNQSIKECARYKFLMGVLYVDIDNFKMINNAMGYEIGNQLLLETAGRLQGCVRQVDSVTRQGKDTFVVILSQLVKQETAAIIIQRMLQSLHLPFIINDTKFTITICIGAAFYPEDGLTPGALCANAEYAMLLAKTHGKHQYQYYQESLQDDSRRELALYNSLSSDSFLDELKLFFQPVMDVSQQSMFCVDTKIHWQHPTLGAVSNDELFNFANRQQKLNKITERVLAKACERFQQWRALGMHPQLLGIPVYLKQLENTNFILHISQILQKNKMEPSWLVLQIQGCGAPVALDVLEKAFNMLQYLGVRISIDNFGNGIFPLRYLKTFSVQYLKLDSAMIQDIVENVQTRSLVLAMVSFASTLSLEIIAAGVDSSAQAEELRNLGIRLLQGKLLSEPLSETEMTGKMTNV